MRKESLMIIQNLLNAEIDKCSLILKSNYDEEISLRKADLETALEELTLCCRVNK